MAESHKYFVKNSNIIFYKLLGTGAGEGFSLVPDFSTYAVLAVWNDYENAKTLTLEARDYIIENLSMNARVGEYSDLYK